MIAMPAATLPVPSAIIAAVAAMTAVAVVAVVAAMTAVAVGCCCCHLSHVRNQSTRFKLSRLTNYCCCWCWW